MREHTGDDSIRAAPAARASTRPRSRGLAGSLSASTNSLDSSTFTRDVSTITCADASHRLNKSNQRICYPLPNHLYKRRHT